jgi:hypothetical protein
MTRLLDQEPAAQRPAAGGGNPKSACLEFDATSCSCNPHATMASLSLPRSPNPPTGPRCGKGLPIDSVLSPITTSPDLIDWR